MKYRIAGLMLAVTGAGTGAWAQTAEELEMVMLGWAAKPLSARITSQYDAEAEGWELATGGDEWDVELLNPLEGRFFGGDKEFFVRVTPSGDYVTYLRDEAGEPIQETTHRLVSASVSSPDEWTILVAWAKGADDAPQRYAEMYIAGDVFVRTDFVEGPDGGRQRTMISAHQRLD